MRQTRLPRLLRLLSLLQAGRPYNAEALAAACKVSRRTIFRDLDALRGAGLPLGFDEEEGAYRMAGAPLVPSAALAALAGRYRKEIEGSAGEEEEGRITNAKK